MALIRIGGIGNGHKHIYLRGEHQCIGVVEVIVLDSVGNQESALYIYGSILQ